ncbi:MAG: hypothetical protein WCG26_12040 [Chloroflexales bacterium]
MVARVPDDSTARVAQAYLEWAYLEDYLRGIGYSLDQMRTLPSAMSKSLMRDASLFASMRLSEVETRSQLIEDLRGGPAPM